MPQPVCTHRHPAYRVARARALARSGGTCQFCGARPATEAHHWALEYPREEETTKNDLIALCSWCHELATALRTAERIGLSGRAIMAAFRNSTREVFDA